MGIRINIKCSSEHLKEEKKHLLRKRLGTFLIQNFEKVNLQLLHLITVCYFGK